MKNIILLTTALLFISCSADSDELVNIKPEPITEYENTLPDFLVGEYDTDRLDSEEGTIRFTSDSLIVKTVNHNFAIKITEYFNQNSDDCFWSIYYMGNEYSFTTSSKGAYTWFKFRKDQELTFYSVGTYEGNPASEPQPEQPQVPNPEIN